MRTHTAPRIAYALIAAASLGLHGCTASYQPPGEAASFSAMGLTTPQERAAATDPKVRAARQAQPLAVMPARLAVVRVQSPGYRSYTDEGYGYGSFSVVPMRNPETDPLAKRLQLLPQVSGLMPISTLLLPNSLSTDEPLRVAAGRLSADLLLINTVATRFTNNDFAPPLGLITLGLFPTKSVEVRATASALVVDTRSGYIYTASEASGKAGQPANGWTSDAAVDDARLRAEQEALTGLVSNIEMAWPGVVNAANNAAARPMPHIARAPTDFISFEDSQSRNSPPSTPVVSNPRTPPGTRYPTNPQ